MPKKQSSSRLSTIAGRVLRQLAQRKIDNCAWRNNEEVTEDDRIMVRDVKALAASCLSQDEVKEQKKRLTTIWLRPGKDFGWKVFEGKVQVAFSPRKNVAITIAKQQAARLKPSRVVLHVGKDKKVLKEFG